MTNGNIPRISAKSDNNGILGYYDTLANTNARHCENFITVNFFGTDGGIFYHPYKASVEMKVHTLKIRNHAYNRYTGVFVAGALRQNLKSFDYGSQLSSSKLKNLDFKIQLPTKNGKIDFNFMERFVAEIENERILKLENYLSENGLTNYELTEKEKITLDNYDNIEWGEFRIGSLFKIAKTKSFNKDKLTDGFEYDYVTRTSENQGILQQTGFVNKQNINKAGNWSLGLLQMDFFYRSKPWYAGQFVRKITATKKFPETSLRFITASLNKLKPILLEVLVRNVESKFLNDKIQLPIKNDKPDYELMGSLTSAIHKLVIKDVVFYVERKKKELNKLTENANA